MSPVLQAGMTYPQHVNKRCIVMEQAETIFRNVLGPQGCWQVYSSGTACLAHCDLLMTWNPILSTDPGFCLHVACFGRQHA